MDSLIATATLCAMNTLALEKGVSHLILRFLNHASASVPQGVVGDERLPGFAPGANSRAKARLRRRLPRRDRTLGSRSGEG
jgi:hypothetical protein